MIKRELTLNPSDFKSQGSENNEFQSPGYFERINYENGTTLHNAEESGDANSVHTDDIMVDQIGYSSKKVQFVCAFLFFLDILINVDHGALPSAAVAIKEDMNMPNALFGSLGSLVFLGLALGSLCATFMLGYFKFK